MRSFEDISANNVPTPPTQTTGPQPAQTTGPNNEFEELLSRSTQKLYPSCDMTTLEFTTEISHVKAFHKITDAGFNKILALLQKACPPSKGYNFPSSYYEIKKTYKKIGLGYESIHACINDCFLFWGSEDNLKRPDCPVCKASRYKDPKKTKGKLVANKIPLIKELQELWKESGRKENRCSGYLIFEMKAALLWTSMISQLEVEFVWVEVGQGLLNTPAPPVRRGGCFHLKVHEKLKNLCSEIKQMPEVLLARAILYVVLTTVALKSTQDQSWLSEKNRPDKTLERVFPAIIVLITRRDAPTVNETYANANEDNEDDVAAHVLDDDDVVVSDEISDVLAMQYQVRASHPVHYAIQQILDQVVPMRIDRTCRAMGRKLPGKAENMIAKKEVEEAQQRAYLASLKADASSQWSTAAYQNTQTLYGTLGTFFGHYNSPNYARPFSPHDFNLVPPPPPGPSMPHAPEWASLTPPPFPTNHLSDISNLLTSAHFLTIPTPAHFLNFLQRASFTIPPVNNNTISTYCYHPFYNVHPGIASSST
ncbi:hypothetical protein Tco_0033069 [Tanacetum coccineum]